jgi:predicted nucleic acid-binding Zn finger protein
LLVVVQPAQDHAQGPVWVVPSQVGTGTYVVDPAEPNPTCSCPDYEDRGEPCKHIFAVKYTVRRESSAAGETVTKTLKVTYREEWSAYNAAQTHEKERVAYCFTTSAPRADNPVQGRARPRLPLSDSIFWAVMKVCDGMSGRRTMTDLRDFAAKGYIDRAPHYNSVFNALEDRAITPLLVRMIEDSVAPLAEVKSHFAADATGFATSQYRRWFSAK